MTDYPVKRTPEEWQVKLTDDQMAVIRGKSTEAPYNGSYDKHMPSGGVYVRQCSSLALQ